MKVIAKKDLFHPATPGAAFKKGNEYTTANCNAYQKFSENTHLRNEQGEPHRVGNWFKYFKVACIAIVIASLGACTTSYHCPTYKHAPKPYYKR